MGMRATDQNCRAMLRHFARVNRLRCFEVQCAAGDGYFKCAFASFSGKGAVLSGRDERAADRISRINEGYVDGKFFPAAYEFFGAVERIDEEKTRPCRNLG